MKVVFQNVNTTMQRDLKRIFGNLDTPRLLVQNHFSADRLVFSEPPPSLAHTHHTPHSPQTHRGHRGGEREDTAREGRSRCKVHNISRCLCTHVRETHARMRETRDRPHRVRARVRARFPSHVGTHAPVERVAELVRCNISRLIAAWNFSEIWRRRKDAWKGQPRPFFTSDIPKLQGIT